MTEKGKRWLRKRRSIKIISARNVTPLGYPYPPEELWRRVKKVIKTPPDELTYQKFGEIFGLEFDEDKMLWYGDRVSGKYFALSTSDIKNIGAFPFKQISLLQGDPDPSNKTRTRRMSFDFILFDITQDWSLLHTQAEKYCVKPERSEVEALGFHYDEIASSMPPPTDRSGVQLWAPYFDEIFVDDLNNRFRAGKTIHLKVLSNGCLVGIHYFNSLKF